MKLNNLYNFKNPVKHFIDIDSLIFLDAPSSLELQDLGWVAPINFRVKKQDDKPRTLKMPNILNFVCSYEHFKDLSNFDDIKNIDFNHKRLSANIDTGDFSSGEYDYQLESDFERLSIYDNLIRVDIKEYYGRIYIHKIKFQGHTENYLSNLNNGETNGLLMGNYLSLYFAETVLEELSIVLEREINESGISCEFSYFSDDFYFFCNEQDNENIIRIFDRVLEKFDFERNENKKEIWTYESFNNYNLVARYWKKLIAHCNIRFKSDRADNKLYFINQIVYRMSKLSDDKMKKVFINNFFKTRYFKELDLEKYQVKNYDYHQLCFIMKFSPESMLYVVNKFRKMSKFDTGRLHTFYMVRYKESLKQLFHEEQLYFYYAISLFGFSDIIKEMKKEVLESENQILISYYLMAGYFTAEEKIALKEMTDEKYWFQNYHLILCSPDLLADLEGSIGKFLMPLNARKDRQKKSYMNFYKENIERKKPIIRNLEGVTREIQEYLDLRIEESEEVFEENTYE